MAMTMATDHFPLRIPGCAILPPSLSAELSARAERILRTIGGGKAACVGTLRPTASSRKASTNRRCGKGSLPCVSALAHRVEVTIEISDFTARAEDQDFFRTSWRSIDLRRGSDKRSMMRKRRTPVLRDSIGNLNLWKSRNCPWTLDLLP